MILKYKKGQEEIAGFALIIILVAVILLVFLGFSLRTTTEEIQSHEAESFVQSFLKYTSDCELKYDNNYLQVKDIINSCSKEEECLDGRSSCEVLNIISKEIIEESWQIEKGSFVKGYILDINSRDKNILNLKNGNMTNNYKSSIQSLPEDIEITFKVFN